MPSLSEEQIIDKLQPHYAAITGMHKAYEFASNPNSLAPAQLPATLFVPQQSVNTLRAHHNIWSTRFTIIASTFVISREAKGGNLAFLENDAISLMLRIRQKFTSQAATEDIMELPLAKIYNFTCRYGAGGELLSLGGVPYIGIITTFEFEE